MTRKIVVVSASRAEKGLLNPVYLELAARMDVEVSWYEFDCEDPVHEFLEAWAHFVKEYEPTIILCPTDRPEMVYIAAYSFHNNIICSHFHAGDIGGFPDEMNRRAISCFSHVMFCNDAGSQTALWRLGEERWRTFCVGSTVLDHITPDESLCPEESYDLVLLHPDPVSVEATKKDCKEALRAIQEPFVVWFYPNKDRNHELIEQVIHGVAGSVTKGVGEIKELLKIDNCSRPQFLGLLKNAQQCIGNSSSFTLEIPFLNSNTKVIKIGLRNLNRNPPNTKVGASKRIAEILATLSLDDKLRRKRLVV